MSESLKQPHEALTCPNLSALAAHQSQPSQCRRRRIRFGTIVQLRRAWALVRRQLLSVLKCATVREVSGNASRAEGMATDWCGDAGRGCSTADHPPGVRLAQGPLGQHGAFVAAGGPEQPALTVLDDAGRVDIGA